MAYYPPRLGDSPPAGPGDITTDLLVEALDFRLVRVGWRRRLTLAVSNPLGDVQREYRRNGYAEVKSHQNALFYTVDTLRRDALGHFTVSRILATKDHRDLREILYTLFVTFYGHLIRRICSHEGSQGSQKTMQA